MCGIAGINYHPQVSELALSFVGAVECMLAAMAHRGPDDSGIYRTDGVVLGHLRLSILDLEGGHQPMFRGNQDLAVVYNGEIYNFLSLRTELADKESFRTRSDTEVLLRVYEECGINFCEKLNGMYAFALWDNREHCLQIAIDPVGIKPLYYYQNETIFMFASELRGLVAGLKSLDIPVERDLDSLRRYLYWGWVPAPETALKGVKKLIPGEQLNCQNGRIRSKKQRALPPAAQLSNDANPVEGLESVLTEAVQRQLVADVPVGVFLSGGVDSTLLTALAVREHSGIETFAIGFSDPTAEAARLNEASWARQVSSILRTVHHEQMVDEKLMLSCVDEVLIATDEPIVDPAVLPLHLLAKFARQRVKVCLAGDGGDELFFGYTRQLLLRWKIMFHRSPQKFRELLVEGSRALPAIRSAPYLEPFRKLRLLIEHLSAIEHVIGPFSKGQFEEMPELLTDRSGTRFELLDKSEDEIFVYELLFQLSGQMLHKTDRISMWSGLEVRVPFLDDKVIGFARALPRSAKESYFRSKPLTRSLLSKFFPAEVSYRRKRGFRPPIASWFRGELAEYALNYLRPGRHSFPEEVISDENIYRLILDHQTGKGEHSIRLWALLAYERFWKDITSNVQAGASEYKSYIHTSR